MATEEQPKWREMYEAEVLRREALERGQSALSAAVAAETERCARIADDAAQDGSFIEGEIWVANQIAAAIRARSGGADAG
jgi:hypothetical protein